MKVKKYCYIACGFIFLTLGTIGTIIPILPTVPFLMVVGFCFARSSEKLNTWLKGTKIYKNNLEDFANGKGMRLKTKIKIMLTVTLLMSIGFIMMGRKGIISGCIVLLVIWGFHILYFCFGIKTKAIE